MAGVALKEAGSAVVEEAVWSDERLVYGCCFCSMGWSSLLTV